MFKDTILLQKLLTTVDRNTEVFLQRLGLWGKGKSLQGLFEYKKKNVGSHAFFRDNKATIILKNIFKLLRPALDIPQKPYKNTVVYK